MRRWRIGLIIAYLVNLISVYNFILVKEPLSLLDVLSYLGVFLWPLGSALGYWTLLGELLKLIGIN